MKYFSLYPHCYIRHGMKNIAVYDVHQRRVFWVTEEKNKKFLKASQSGRSIDSICREYGSNEFFSYAELLQSLDWGAIYSAPTVSMKYRPFIHPYLEEKNGFYIPLSVVTLELTSYCPGDCWFCESDKRICSSECVCGRYSTSTQVSYDIEQTLARLSHAKPAMLEISGGDPFSNRGDLQRILTAAYELGIPVKVKSAGRLIDENDILLLKENAATLTLVLSNLSVESESTDIENLVRILNSGARHKYHAISTVMICDEAHYNSLVEVREWLEKLHVPVEAVGLNFPKEVKSLTKSLRREHFKSFAPKRSYHYAIGINELARGIWGNQCRDRICIMANGEVRPCIADATTVYGNVNEENILDIIKNRPVTGSKQFSEDSICSNCEFSLGCFTCSVTNEKMGFASDSGAWNCMYQPSEGLFLE